MHTDSLQTIVVEQAAKPLPFPFPLPLLSHPQPLHGELVPVFLISLLISGVAVSQRAGRFTADVFCFVFFSFFSFFPKLITNSVLFCDFVKLRFFFFHSSRH